MAWLTLRNDHLLLDLCPELKNASFETLGAKVAELGLTLDFDIAAELAQIEAKKRRSSVKTSARSALRQKIHWALGAGLKRRSNGRNERQQAALLRCSRLRTVGEPIRAIASFAGGLRARSPRARLCVAGHNWTTMASMFDVCDRTAKRLFEGAKQALGFAGTGLSRSRAPRTSFTLHEQH